MGASPLGTIATRRAEGIAIPYTWRMRLGFPRNVALLCTIALGCGDDGGSSSDGGASSGSTGPTDPAGTSTGAADGESTAGDQGGTDSSGDDTTGPPPPTEVSVRGTLLDFFAMGPIAGAEFSVEGDPALVATSNDAGEWQIDGIPVDSSGRFIIADSENYWGSVIPYTTMFEDISEFEASQVSLQVIDLQIQALQMQEPSVMVEEDTAVFLVALIQNTATGATVTLDPPPPENTYYAPNADGQPILNVTEIQWGLYPVAVFFNLPPGPEGTYEITVAHPERECTPDDSQPPTFGRHINLIRVDCPPPE